MDDSTRTRPAWLAPCLLATAAFLLIGSQLLSRLDGWLYDALAGLRPDHRDHAALTVIAVDEKSLAELGRWPWPRSDHARLLDKLGQARAVGLDIAMIEPSPHPEGDRLLAAALRRNGKVAGPVFPELHGRLLVEARPLPLLADAMAALGHIDFEQDSDGIIRRVYLKAGLNHPRYDSFAGTVAALAQDRAAASPPALAAPPGSAWLRAQPVMIPFAKGKRPYQLVSYADALNRLSPASFAGRIVLIGATATGLGDTHPTPVSANDRGMSGVEINAFLLHGMLEGLLARPLDPFWQAALGALLLGLADWRLSRLRPARRLLAGYLLGSAAILAAAGGALFLARIWTGGGVAALLLAGAGGLRYTTQQSRLNKLALTDGLTGLANRRSFDEAFAAALAAHRRRGKPLALVLVDLDNFKGYNDRYGHYAGDDVLRHTAKTLRRCFRQKGEMPVRLGGEEFGVLLTDRDEAAALQAAERFRQSLEALALPHAANPPGRVTCSIGVVARVPEPDGARQLFEDADQALYLAKGSGRNRVCGSAGLSQAT
ncbi:CHASE2 domain-containing protein [Chromobacterium paludis]|uniref:diguanylate cyclase n=1 Tax=Chromobacterium paludis TaxID=2605945 RepID=A0A5C1DIP5_9NEIS|nr:CHASE2 domain-containing protein [Chromobacterium paludis]QEL55917.1 CHASE2 domain-containing protein [Chromobacterium paludis]